MEAVAVYENVYCKISGIVTEADWQNWKPEDFTPYLHVVVNAWALLVFNICPDTCRCVYATKRVNHPGGIGNGCRKYKE